MNRSTHAIATLATAQMRLRTPLGEMLLARTAGGLAGAWFTGQTDHPGVLPAAVSCDDPLLQRAAQQINDHCNGKHTRFDVPLDLHGTPFQVAVWQALLCIERGQTQSYADIARAVGRTTAVRAVGAAVGKNPVSVIVPCHRVIGSDGSLTGYAGGLDRKRALLRCEGALR
jgi:methylated-DNA-[protein]-cysteine S-methyltransferase